MYKRQIKGTKNPQKMLQCGVPFTKKPVALQFDYKVKMSDRENRILSLIHILSMQH